MASGMETRRYPFGIAPALTEVERSVPADEAPPLAPNAKLEWIGKPVARSAGRAKVTGAARFTVDVKLPGMLHGRLLRSPHPHARLLGLDFAAARAQPGVRAALALNETVGRAVEAPPAGGGAEARRVLYVGDIVAGVAADSPAAAEAALGLIKADYQPLPFVVDLEGARQPDAPRVFERPVHGEDYAGAIASASPPPRRATCAARTAPARAVTRPRRWRAQKSWSRGSSAPRCRRTAAWRPTRWWRTGAPTDSPCTCRPSSPPASGASSRTRSACRSGGCGWWSTRWAAASVRSRVPATTCAPRYGCRARRARRCASCSTGARSRSTAATGRPRCRR